MKAEDLMIGDLVYYSYANQYAAKVIDVCGHGEEPFIRCKRDERDELYKLNQFEDFHVGILRPIPLTIEILKKNGYVYNEMRDVWELIPNNGYGVCCNDDGTFEFCLGVFDGYHGDIIYHYIADVEYVHKLQHMLKDCKIEKEIIV